MKKNTIYLTAVLGLFAIAYAFYVGQQNICNCVQFKKYNEVKIYPNARIETRTDSICVVSGNKKGELFLKKLN